jgi:hypothetical protein
MSAFTRLGDAAPAEGLVYLGKTRDDKGRPVAMLGIREDLSRQTVVPKLGKDDYVLLELEHQHEPGRKLVLRLAARGDVIYREFGDADGRTPRGDSQNAPRPNIHPGLSVIGGGTRLEFLGQTWQATDAVRVLPSTMSRPAATKAVFDARGGLRESNLSRILSGERGYHLLPNGEPFGSAGGNKRIQDHERVLAAYLDDLAAGRARPERLPEATPLSATDFVVPRKRAPGPARSAPDQRLIPREDARAVAAVPDVRPIVKATAAVRPPVRPLQPPQAASRVSGSSSAPVVQASPARPAQPQAPSSVAPSPVTRAVARGTDGHVYFLVAGKGGEYMVQDLTVSEQLGAYVAPRGTTGVFSTGPRLGSGTPLFPGGPIAVAVEPAPAASRSPLVAEARALQNRIEARVAERAAVAAVRPTVEPATGKPLSPEDAAAKLILDTVGFRYASDHAKHLALEMRERSEYVRAAVGERQSELAAEVRSGVRDGASAELGALTRAAIETNTYPHKVSSVAKVSVRAPTGLAP